MKAPDGEDGQEKQRDIGDGVDNSSGQNQHIDIHTMARNIRVPNSLSGDARGNLDNGIGQVERRVEPKEQVDEDIRPALPARREDAEVEQQNGEFGDEYQRAVHDL